MFRGPICSAPKTTRPTPPSSASNVSISPPIPPNRRTSPPRTRRTSANSPAVMPPAPAAPSRSSSPSRCPISSRRPGGANSGADRPHFVSSAQTVWNRPKARRARLVARWGVDPVRLAAQAEVAKPQPGGSGGRASVARRPAAQPGPTIPRGLSCGPAALAAVTRPRRRCDWHGFRNPGDWRSRQQRGASPRCRPDPRRESRPMTSGGKERDGFRGSRGGFGPDGEGRSGGSCRAMNSLAPDAWGVARAFASHPCGAPAKRPRPPENREEPIFFANFGRCPAILLG